MRYFWKLTIFALAIFISLLPASADTRLPGLVSFDFVDADLIYVLKVLAKESNVDFLLAPDVEGSVTITVKNAPIADLLPTVLAAQKTDYRYVFRDGFLCIGPAERLTAVPSAAELKGTVTLDFVNADLMYVLEILAQHSGRKLVTAKEVEGSVTVTAKERSIADLLPRVLAMQKGKFEYELREGQLLVAPAGRLENGRR